MANRNPVENPEMEEAILKVIRDGAKTRKEIHFHVFHTGGLRASASTYNSHIRKLIAQNRIVTFQSRPRGQITFGIALAKPMAPRLPKRNTSRRRRVA